MIARYNRLSSFLKSSGVDAMLINKPESRRYITGFTGSAGMVLCDYSCEYRKLFVDFRYMEQASQQASQWEIVKAIQNSLTEIAVQARSAGFKRIGFESDFITVDAKTALDNAFADFELVPLKLADLRKEKDENEIRIIETAVEIAEMALNKVIKEICPGAKERDIAILLETYMRKAGADGSAFDIIVASGVRSALPHGRASDKLIESGDFVTLDFGAYFKGYNSDITRTFVVGKASEKHRVIYDTVLAAQLAALQAVRAGVENHSVDKVARDYITAAGYGECFGHGLGHGLGMLVHEAPGLSYAAEPTILQINNIVTVEPGIYVPGFGGVRIEDDVVVKENGCEILTSFDKRLIEL
ncbi:MAG: Xaa-Pro peptidase family protein [Negativicutes bacterium]|jgi:Xaa-Pro aminopeptidase